MNVFDKLAKQAVAEIGDKSPAWVEREAQRIREALPQENDFESKALRDAGEFALSRLVRNKEVVGRLGQAGAAAFFGQLAMGNRLEATRFAGDRLRYLREAASWSELDAEVTSAAGKTRQAKADADAAEALAKDVGVTAAKTILPFLLASLAAL